MDDGLRSVVAGIVGVAAVGSDSVVRASNAVQLRDVLDACAGAGASVAAAGSAGEASADVLISGERLDTVTVDTGALLLRAGAAASWSAIREAAAARKLAVTALPSLRSDRAGPAVAAGEIPHRALAGVDFLTAAGELISTGGRTLKDVVGYDLAGLALGSGDRLGMIVAVTLRLEPAATRTPPEPGPGPWRGDAGIDLARALSGGGSPA